MRPARRVAAVLFDLDGTLLDSAPDLAGTANDLRARRGLPPLPLHAYRPHGGSGARGMLGVGFGLAPGAPGYAELRDEFLAHYATRSLAESRLFGAAQALLLALIDQGLPWGIVTNKALHLAEPIAQALPPLDRAGALVGGDSTSHLKPHPAPLLEAARRLGVEAARCVYVGDDPRDMQAGRAAGMSTLAAAWGYLGTGSPPEDWPADAVLADAGELLQWLRMP